MIHQTFLSLSLVTEHLSSIAFCLYHLLIQRINRENRLIITTCLTGFVISCKLLYVFYDHPQNLHLEPKQMQKKDASMQSLTVNVLMSTDLHHICPEGQCTESIKQKQKQKQKQFEKRTRHY